MRPFILSIFLLMALVAIAQSVNSYIKEGNLFYKQSQFEQAESSYRQAVNADPANVEARFNLANALHQQKKFDEADRILAELQTGSADSSIRSASAYNQGVGHTKQKKLEESIAAYKQALRMDPEDQQARENLQKALRELKKQQQSQSQQQNKQSNMEENEADQKLKLLQQKERQIRQRVQKNSQATGGSQSRDW
jgi:Ca-activated chloride channel homolog